MRTVELGIQSTSDAVLTASGRGHTAADSERACRMVREAGFELVGQMMIGLPLSDAEREKQTARDLVAFGAEAARIYPTVVFAGTQLEAMTARGTYRPLSLDEAVTRSADAYEILNAGGVRCLRIGLCASEELTDPRLAVAGPNHPALGELVLGEVRYRELARAVAAAGLGGRRVALTVPAGRISQTVGQGRRNLARLEKEYGTVIGSVGEDARLSDSRLEPME